jgi:hypothetical protein
MSRVDRPPALQWQFNGVPLPGETNSTLLLRDVWPPDAGTYELLANNASGSATSAPKALLVVMTNDLGRVLDAPWMPWQNGGVAAWIPQAAVTHDGQEAATSGGIGDGQATYVETHGVVTIRVRYRCREPDSLFVRPFSCHFDIKNSHAPD